LCCGAAQLTALLSGAAEAFAAGISDVLPARALAPFSAPELSLLLSGLETIDVEDWQANTAYSGGYSRLDPQVLWFWGVVKAMEQAERALLLKFATGSSRVPSGGFAALYGLSGPTKFTLARVEVSMDSSAGAAVGPLGARDKERSLLLPTASACFNMLKLPAYPRFEVLEKKLLTAVRCGAEGFAFA